MATYFTAQTLFDLSILDEQINHWNSIVKDNDDVFILGDFAKDPISAEEAIYKLKGRLCCLSGQWDEQFLTDLGLRLKLPNNKFSVVFYNILNIPEYNIVLSYWRLADWSNKDLDSLCVYGKKEYEESYGIGGKSYCCSFEQRGRLIPIEEIIKEVNKI